MFRLIFVSHGTHVMNYFVSGDFYPLRTQDVEVTKSLQYTTYTTNKSSIVELPCSCYYDKPCDYSHHFFLLSHDTSDIPTITGSNNNENLTDIIMQEKYVFI